MSAHDVERDAAREPRSFVVRAGKDREGARLTVLNVENGAGVIVAPTYDAYAEGNLAYRVLLELPPETRRELYLLITNNADHFNAGPYSKSTKSHPWPPKPRRPQ